MSGSMFPLRKDFECAHKGQEPFGQKFMKSVLIPELGWKDQISKLHC